MINIIKEMNVNGQSYQYTLPVQFRSKYYAQMYIHADINREYINENIKVNDTDDSINIINTDTLIASYKMVSASKQNMPYGAFYDDTWKETGYGMRSCLIAELHDLGAYFYTLTDARIFLKHLAPEKSKHSNDMYIVYDNQGVQRETYFIDFISTNGECASASEYDIISTIK